MFQCLRFRCSILSSRPPGRRQRGSGSRRLKDLDLMTNHDLLVRSAGYLVESLAKRDNSCDVGYLLFRVGALFVPGR